MERKIKEVEDIRASTHKEVREIEKYINGILQDKKTVFEAAASIPKEIPIEFRKLVGSRNLVFSLLLVGWLELSTI